MGDAAEVEFLDTGLYPPAIVGLARDAFNRGRAAAQVVSLPDRETLIDKLARIYSPGAYWNLTAEYPTESRDMAEAGVTVARCTVEPMVDAILPLFGALSTQPAAGEVEARLRVAATVPYPGSSSDADFMRAAAENLEHHYEVGGSNLRAAVVRVLRVVAETIGVQS